MKLFSKKQKDSSCAVQTAPKGSSAVFGNFAENSAVQYPLYEALRENVPVIDAALTKLVRLLGTFEVKVTDSRFQPQLDDFVKNVRTSGAGIGLQNFVCGYFDRMLTFGEAVGEVMVDPDFSGVYGLYTASYKDVKLRLASDPTKVLVCRCDRENTPFENQDLLLCTLLSPEPCSAKGTPILKGLPFVSMVLMRIFESVSQNFERAGNIRYAVSYKPQQGSTVNAAQRAREIATEWSRAMRDQSGVSDFISVGDVSVRVIGADNQVLDCDVPIKHLLEQIVSKLCIPPFLLGLSWSSTERMSTVQADILTSEIEYYRTLLEPVIRKICTLHLRMLGCRSDVSVSWSNISLLDEVELARARLLSAQAREVEKGLEVQD